MVGPEVEETALVRHCSRLFVTGANVTVPIVTIVLRKSYGLGAQAMMGGSTKAPLACVAWPTGEFGGMGLEGYVRLGYRKELEAVDDPDEREALFAGWSPACTRSARRSTSRRTSRSTTSSTRPTRGAGSRRCWCPRRSPPGRKKRPNRHVEEPLSEYRRGRTMSDLRSSQSSSRRVGARPRRSPNHRRSTAEGYGGGRAAVVPREGDHAGALGLMRDALVPDLLQHGCEHPSDLYDRWAGWRGNPMAKTALEFCCGIA